MKKLLFLFSALLMLALCVTASAEVVNVTAQASMGMPYHQVSSLFIEYSEEVVAPTTDDYVVVDYNTYNLKEDYERRPYDAGVITAVYTNNAPALLPDKTSVPGKYVVIELATTDGSYYDEMEQIWKPSNVTGIATWRLIGDSSEYLRKDWSLFVVTQRKDVLNAKGDIVNAKGVLPALPNEAVYTPEVACFEQIAIPSETDTAHDINFNIALPENYDASKKYPVVFCQPGGGGGLNYKQQDEQGNFICLGCDVTRDGVLTAFVRRPEELIVVGAQPWKNVPEEWTVDNSADYIQLIEYVLKNYAADPERVYLLASSQGTRYSAEAIMRRPDLITAYALCNGGFNQFTLCKPELMVPFNNATAKEVMAICQNPENHLDAETIAEKGKAFDGVVEYEIPIYLFDGTNTQSGCSLNTFSNYIYLTQRYTEKGLTQQQIDELLQIHVADDDEFHPLGVCEYHASSKIAVTEGYDVIDWLLSR